MLLEVGDHELLRKYCRERWVPRHLERWAHLIQRFDRGDYDVRPLTSS
jgi:succinate dehydrogenase/fumarate reductase flavoprotein subunit